MSLVMREWAYIRAVVCVDDAVDTCAEQGTSILILGVTVQQTDFAGAGTYILQSHGAQWQSVLIPATLQRSSLCKLVSYCCC